MAQAKLGDTDPEEVLHAMKIDKVTLKSIIDGIRGLLKPFRSNMSIKLEETNGILEIIRIEIEIKNLR